MSPDPLLEGKVCGRDYSKFGKESWETQQSWKWGLHCVYRQKDNCIQTVRLWNCVLFFQYDTVETPCKLPPWYNNLSLVEKWPAQIKSPLTQIQYLWESARFSLSGSHLYGWSFLCVEMKTKIAVLEISGLIFAVNMIQRPKFGMLVSTIQSFSYM